MARAQSRHEALLHLSNLPGSLLLKGSNPSAAAVRRIAAAQAHGNAGDVLGYLAGDARSKADTDARCPADTDARCQTGTDTDARCQTGTK